MRFAALPTLPLPPWGIASAQQTTHDQGGGGIVIIVYDQREQRPYTFEGERYEDVTAEAATLYTADYSLKGLEDKIGIERKTLDDLAGTLTAGRERFQRECERGRGLDYFALVIEASMEDARQHNYRSKMTPQSLLQTLAAYSIRYGLHVHWCGSRAGGEYTTYSLLQKYLREATERLKAISKAHKEFSEARI